MAPNKEKTAGSKKQAKTIQNLRTPSVSKKTLGPRTNITNPTSAISQINWRVAEERDRVKNKTTHIMDGEISLSRCIVANAPFTPEADTLLLHLR